ncbi:MAG: hypothetical protein C6W56_10405 [Caldibacillus debilis]|nr:MAG: hypothetical protein C6W56_10405 [Caldibacillus debilis]
MSDFRLAFKIRRTENGANFKAGETSSGGFPPFPVPAQKILPFPKTEIAGDFFRWERRVRIRKNDPCGENRRGKFDSSPASEEKE